MNQPHETYYFPSSMDLGKRLHLALQCFVIFTVYLPFKAYISTHLGTPRAGHYEKNTLLTFPSG